MKFYDVETKETITIEQLYNEFKQLQTEQPEEYNYNFNQYILNCTDKNGTLQEIKEG